MGSASSLFFSGNDAEKQTLCRRITPSDEQFEDQQERWNHLADHLISDLKDRSGYTIRTWLQGSYKFGTQIRPVRIADEFDIDLGVYFEWEGKPTEGKHGPRTLKGFGQDSLGAYAKANEADVSKVAPPKQRCCRIHYKNSFHIDVPAYHLDPSKNTRTLATENEWEKSDPKAIYLWFRDLLDDLARAKVRRQIKYLKAWGALKFEETSRPSSILLTVLVAEAAEKIGSDGLISEDETLQKIVEAVIARLKNNSSVPNPVDKTENLARLSQEEMESFLHQLGQLSDIAQRANGKTNEFEAADVWQEAFDHLFPMPEAVEKFAEAGKLPVPIATPEVKVTAISRDNPRAGQFSGLNTIGPIPKNCDIYFEIMNTYALPAGSTIHWTVRNEGREAENINDLGHRGGTGPRWREYSAYKGTHYMDCVVKVGTNTVAIRRVPVIITGQEMPRRAAVRPAWVKLRGRK